jgi:hypothetical protein
MANKSEMEQQKIVRNLDEKNITCKYLLKVKKITLSRKTKI